VSRSAPVERPREADLFVSDLPRCQHDEPRRTRQEIGATSCHRDLQQVTAPIGPVFQMMAKLGGLRTAEQGRDGCINGWADAIIGEGFPNVPTLALK